MLVNVNNKNKFDYKSMNFSIAKILFNYLTSYKEDNNSNKYTFDYTYQNIKFIDIIQNSFNYIIEPNINTEEINRLIHNHTHSLIGEKTSYEVGNNNVLSMDVNFSYNSPNFKNENNIMNKLTKAFQPSIKSYRNKNGGKNIKSNIVETDLFVKNLDHRFIIENMSHSISEKIKAR